MAILAEIFKKLFQLGKLPLKWSNFGKVIMKLPPALYENVSDNLNNRQCYQLGCVTHSCVHIC